MKLLPEGMKASQELALEELGAFDRGGMADFLGAHEGWREAPAAVLRSSGWRVVCARQWRHRAAIHELEAHALLWAARRLATRRDSGGSS